MGDVLSIWKVFKSCQKSPKKSFVSDLQRFPAWSDPWWTDFPVQFIHCTHPWTPVEPLPGEHEAVQCIWRLYIGNYMVFMGFSTECIRKVERSVNVMPLLQNYTKGFCTQCIQKVERSVNLKRVRWDAAWSSHHRAPASIQLFVLSSARIYVLVYYDLTFKFTGSTLHTTASQCCSNFLGTFYLTCSTVNITLNNIEHHFSLNWTLAHSDTATPQSPLVETSVERNQPEKCHLSVVWRALQSSIVKDNHNLDINEGHTYVERNYAREVRPVSFVRRALTVEEVPLETQGALLSSGIIWSSSETQETLLSSQIGMVFSTMRWKCGGVRFHCTEVYMYEVYCCTYKAQCQDIRYSW